MRYIKTLGMKDCQGCYYPEIKTILIDYSGGYRQALRASFHEFLHSVMDKLSIEDWLDLFDPLIRAFLIGKGKEFFQLFKVIFLTEHQNYYPDDDPQRIP